MSKILTLFFLLICSASVFGQKTAPEWSKSATIYEVNIRQFTPEGTFKAFAEHVPRLKKMGVDILWLMPIHPIGEKNRKGSLGSYYAIRDYEAVNPEFGNINDFKDLVKLVHDNGMKLIIDWVANHTSPDNVWVDQGHKDWYTLDSTGNLQPTIGTDWWDVADLNYDNREMRKAMINSMKFWLTNADIDGFRCDVAGWVPIDYWVDARRELDAVKKVFMLAEAEELPMTKAFDMTYGWEFHHIMNGVAQDKKKVSDLVNYFKNDKYPADHYKMNFTSNHDENSWNGTEMERMGNSYKTFAVFASLIDGMPLVYNGQETSLKKRLRFFEKDTIEWKKMDLVSFYTDLLKLHQKNPALWNGKYGSKPTFLFADDNQKTLAFIREKDGNQVLCLLNFSDKKQSISLKSDALKGKYKNLFCNKSKKLNSTYTVELEPFGYQVFYK
jgi:glycosidase